MSDYDTPALDAVEDADQHVGDPVQAEHDLDVTSFTETDDE